MGAHLGHELQCVQASLMAQMGGGGVALRNNNISLHPLTQWNNRGCCCIVSREEHMARTVCRQHTLTSSDSPSRHSQVNRQHHLRCSCMMRRTTRWWDWRLYVAKGPEKTNGTG